MAFGCGKPKPEKVSRMKGKRRRHDATSIPDNEHREYPYLLRDRTVEWADGAWCADITYVPMPHGHAYLCAVMDWRSRKVLGWAVSKHDLRADGQGAGGGRGAMAGPSRDLQHRSRQPVHVAGMDGKTRRRGGSRVSVTCSTGRSNSGR